MSRSSCGRFFAVGPKSGCLRMGEIRNFLLRVIDRGVREPANEFDRTQKTCSNGHIKMHRLTKLVSRGVGVWRPKDFETDCADHADRFASTFPQIRAVCEIRGSNPTWYMAPIGSGMR